MSTVGSTSSTTSTAGAAADAATSVLGKDDFLKLLMTQMQNQDPLNPTDDTAFVAQLAQFSSVEQMTNMNDTMNQLLIAQAGANQTATASLVGKSVEISSNTVTLGATTPVPLSGTISGTAGNVTATIVDANGKTVRTINAGPSASGAWSGNWDGKDDSGNALPAGTYTVNLTATDASGNALSATATSKGIVTGVSFVNGAAQLVVNGQTIPLSQVLEIDQAPASSSP